MYRDTFTPLAFTTRRVADTFTLVGNTAAHSFSPLRLSLALLEPREGECLEQAEQLAGWRVRALGLPLMP